MKTHATIGTTPIPPLATTHHSASGIVHAKSTTGTSYSFSCVFGAEAQINILAFIKKEFSKYTSAYINTEFRKELPGEYMYTIALKATELKLEYRLYTTDVKTKKQQKVIKRFDNLEQAIINL